MRNKMRNKIVIININNKCAIKISFESEQIARLYTHLLFQTLGENPPNYYSEKRDIYYIYLTENQVDVLINNVNQNKRAKKLIKDFYLLKECKDAETE